MHEILSLLLNNTVTTPCLAAVRISTWSPNASFYYYNIQFTFT